MTTTNDAKLGADMLDDRGPADPRDAGKGKWLVLLAAFLGWMFDGMEMGIFPLIASPALTEFKADVAKWNGTFHMVFLLGAAAGGLVFGWLGDKIGRVRAMTLSVLAYSVFTGIGYFANAAWQLAVLRFFAALGMGGEWALGVALVMEIWPEKLRPMMAGIIGAASNVGFALIAGLGMFIKIDETQWRWVLLAGLSPALLTFVIRLFVPESERWKHSVQVHGGTAKPVREIFSGSMLRVTLLAILFASVALIGTWGSAQWIPVWVDKELATGNPHAKATAQFLSSIGAIIGCLVAPLVGGMLGRRPTYFLLCLTSLGASALLFLTTESYDNVFLAKVFLVGMTTASFYGWLPLYLPELFRTRVRATGQGVSFNSGRILAAGGALVAGSLVNSFAAAGYGKGWAMSGVTITLIYIVGMIAIWFAPETKGKPLPE
ncbi:MAG: MFS transporter [Phycisphaerae bacterium]|nr:MFS transporter [Tepidisphaeraceae bacterium]